MKKDYWWKDTMFSDNNIIKEELERIFEVLGV